ncbi:MAG TPA: helix-turn-helix domain-containing protein, partial [Gemmatimonadales bacterium]|nr:helix-turn-helix domain-containing protein [Gemmatimonadales bacterium]
HFLRRFSAKYGRDVRRLDPEARRGLLTYPWPGNVRELSHVIERAVLWSRGPELTPEHLSLTHPAGAVPSPAAPSEAAPGPGAPGLPPEGMGLEQWERTMLIQALREAGGNQTRAAQRLGISRDTLRYRLKKYEISP